MALLGILARNRVMLAVNTSKPSRSSRCVILSASSFALASNLSPRSMACGRSMALRCPEQPKRSIQSIRGILSDLTSWVLQKHVGASMSFKSPKTHHGSPEGPTTPFKHIEKSHGRNSAKFLSPAAKT